MGSRDDLDTVKCQLHSQVGVDLSAYKYFMFTLWFFSFLFFSFLFFKYIKHIIIIFVFLGTFWKSWRNINNFWHIPYVCHVLNGLVYGHQVVSFIVDSVASQPYSSIMNMIEGKFYWSLVGNSLLLWTRLKVWNLSSILLIFISITGLDEKWWFEGLYI